jgi:hypothetical protein
LNELFRELTRQHQETQIMEKSKQSRTSAPMNRARLFQGGVLVVILLAAGVVMAVARYESSTLPKPETTAAKSPASNFVTVEVGGKKIQVNALTLQQGPLTQDQSQQIADALKDNKSTDGLVQVQHADGTVEMDLQGRFQNVMLAKKNDDGSVSEACVDSPEAAGAFLQSKDATSVAERNRKAAVKE